MNLKEKLINFAESYPHEEVCGLVGPDDFLPCRNINENKKHFFTIHPKDTLLAYRKFKQIIAVFHSHVENQTNFSEFDYQQSERHNLPYWLYCLKTKEFKILEPNHARYKKYLNKQFEEGLQDCFSLVCDFYKKEFDITIFDPFVERAKNFRKIQTTVLEQKFYLDLIKINNFKPIHSDFKIFDILIFKFDNRLHMGIYLKPNQILHQLRNKNSCIEILTNEYFNNFLIGARKHD